MAPPVTMQSLKHQLSETESSIARCLEGIASGPDSPPGTDAVLPDGLPSMMKDLLLTLRHTTTSLALAFKPPLTLPAAAQTLDKFIMDLVQVTMGVYTTATLVLPGILLDDWKDGVTSICLQASHFIRALSDTTSSNGSGSQASDDNPYLHHTAMIWERIDALHANLPSSEGEAVAMRWKSDTDLVKDAWTEFKESIEEMEVTSGTVGEGDGAKEDDEWDEDDMGDFGSKDISEEEHKTVEAIKPVLQLLQLLHAFLPRFIPSLDFNQPSRGRDFVRLSANFSSLFDDLVCALYPTHSTNGIDYALSQADEIVEDMIREVRASQPNEAGETFLRKWEERMTGERIKWDERRLSLGSLIDSLN